MSLVKSGQDVSILQIELNQNSNKKLYSFRYSVFFVLMLSVNLALSVDFVCEPRKIYTGQQILSSCSIKELKSINAKDVLNVNLNYTKLEEITDIELVKTGQDLPEIDYIPSELFVYFPKVTGLHFQSKLKALTENSFKNALGLTGLTLGPEITNIGVNAFNGAKNIKYLTLSSNKITTIDDNAFSGLSELLSLSLENNQLTEIHRNTFAGLSKLTSLTIYKNNIHTVEDGSFNLPNLELLFISENKLKTLPDTIFATIQKLENLYIEKNLLENIPESIYSLTNAKRIGLSDNQIQNINLKKLAKLPKLDSLILDNSGFSFEKWIDDSSPIESNLNFLNIAKNNLTDPKQLNHLKFLTNLETIILNDNLYTNLDLGEKTTIKNILPKLKALHLARNKINKDELLKIAEELKAIDIKFEADIE